MGNILFRPPKSYVGDVIPFYEDGTYYLFFLNDTRKSERPADMTAWNLVTTQDFVTYRHMGTVLPAGKIDEPDNCCYTGSVFKAGACDYHMFYTAHNNYSEAFMENGHPIQTVMHATSNDLLNWEKHPARFGGDSARYSRLDWRDPFVYFNPEEGCYNMLLAARHADGSFRRGGCVLKCRSNDLWNWSVGEPLYDPQKYFAHECPDLFFMNGWWYLAYSTFTERFATHYRMSRSINGPWLAKDEDTWDARAFYAAKTAGDGKCRYAFGWIPTRSGRTDSGRYEWGGNLCVHELVQRSDGVLNVRMPDPIVRAFSNVVSPRPSAHTGDVEDAGGIWRLRARERDAYLIFDELPRQCIIEARVALEERAHSFGVDLNVSRDLDDGYLFRFEPFYNRLVFDRWPRAPLSDDCAEQHYLGGDIPFQVELERPLCFNGVSEINIRLLIEDDMAVCYANDAVALSARVYNLLPNRRWALFVSDGSISVHGLRLRTMAD